MPSSALEVGLALELEPHHIILCYNLLNKIEILYCLLRRSSALEASLFLFFFGGGPPDPRSPFSYNLKYSPCLI